MGHTLQANTSAPLECFGGLVTNTNALDLPEGASPRCFDCDFITGSVFTRAGLSSLYQFSGNTLGPNNGNSVQDVLVNGNAWSGASGFLGNAAFASCTISSGSLPNFSDLINVTNFNFVIPSTSTITHITATITASGSAGSTLSMQLLKNGVPIGTIYTITLSSSNVNYTFDFGPDSWGTTFLFSDINNTRFGVQVQAAFSGYGTVSAQNVQVSVAVASSKSNFNYVKTYTQSAGPLGQIPQINTLALDAQGNLWIEDVTSDPGNLSIALSDLLPGSFAKSVTAEDREYIVFSNLTQGTDRPRQMNGTSLSPTSANFFPISQCGPGAPPSFTSSVGTSNNDTLAITGYSLTSQLATFTYTAGPTVTANTLYTLSGFTSTDTFLNGLKVYVLSTGLSSTQFEAYIFTTHADVPSGGAGTATLTFSYGITSITQPAHIYANGQILLWSSGPGSTSPGTTVTFYYGSTNPSSVNQAFQNAVLSGRYPVYVYITGAPAFNGTWLVTNASSGKPPGETGNVPYFTFTAPTSGYQKWGSPSGGGNTGYFQQTLATVKSATPIPNVSTGDNFIISQAAPSQWNATWPVVYLLNGAVLNITSTAMSSAGVATYGYTVQSGTGPVNGVPQLITITNCTNGNGIFNCTGVISSVSGGTFTVAGFTSGAIAQQVESGATGVTFGTQFNIDPGPLTLGTTTNPIYGSYSGNAGTITIIGGSITPIGAGTRQAVVFFITESGYETAPSPPVTFTTSTEANYISCSNIPIGPPNVIARGIAFTEAGQNGVPGANFYVIDDPVTITVNNTTTTYTSTIIRDNITTSAQFTFTDAVLLNSREIDIQGQDLFNLIELGSCAWCVPYANRMFYGMQLNKVQNFNNLSFDGGYVPNSTPIVNSLGQTVGAASGNLTPLGWTVDPTVNAQTGPSVSITAFSISSNVVTLIANNTYSANQTVLISGLSTGTYLNDQIFTVLPTGLNSNQFQVQFVHGDVSLTSDSGTAVSTSFGVTLEISPVTGTALYMQNTVEGTLLSQVSMISQPAFQDAYQVAIIQPNTQYSVRVSVSNPSGIAGGSAQLVIDLTDFISGSSSGAWGRTYGTFAIPLTSMSTNQQVFTGSILTNTFTQGTSPNLRLRAYMTNPALFADVLIDRIEVYPTQQPVLNAQVYGSYINDLEALDASGSGGIIDTTSENPQTCYGAVVMKNALYLLKESSIYVTEDTPNSEPGGWTLDEVSPVVGTCGINAYDSGEGWFVTACRKGIYGSDGRPPQKVNQEIKEVWDAIFWDAGNTIVLRNDIQNRKLYCAVPLPTGPTSASYQWLPNAPTNLTPSTPNVILMCNYQGCDDFAEFISAKPVHVTMFGTLMATDNKRKWSIWQIPTPYMAFCAYNDGLGSGPVNGLNTPLYICNGDGSSNIYQLLQSQLSDNGIAINSDYCTYGFVSPTKAKEYPMLGLGNKQFTSGRFTMDGSGTASVVLRKNVLQDPTPWSIPGGLKLSSPSYADFDRPLNIPAASRVFVEVSTNAVGAAFRLSKMMLTGKKSSHAPQNPTGGGNVGITDTQG